MTSFPTPDHIAHAQSTALEVYAATGFYRWPSAVLAQAIIESSGFVHLAARNNGLGIKDFRPGKGTINTTHETIGGQDKILPQPFANFDTIRDCYLSNAWLFYRAKNRDGTKIYAEALKAPNAETFIRAMAPHYATAPNYAEVLLKLCRDRKLYQYDEPHGQSVPTPAPAPTPSLWSRLTSWLKGAFAT